MNVEQASKVKTRRRASNERAKAVAGRIVPLQPKRPTRPLFDGVPSQHDGKDAGTGFAFPAVVAELARLGKSAAWPWVVASERRRQIELLGGPPGRATPVGATVRRAAGRRLARHGSTELAEVWPEVLRQLKLTSPTLLNALLEWGGPAGLAALAAGDEQAATAKLKRWGRGPLSDEAIARVIDGARRSLWMDLPPKFFQSVRGQRVAPRFVQNCACGRRVRVKRLPLARQHLAGLSGSGEPSQ